MARYPSNYPATQHGAGVSRVSSVQGNRKTAMNGNSFPSPGYSTTTHKASTSRVSSIQKNRKASLDGNSFTSRYSPSSRSVIQWHGQGSARIGGVQAGTLRPAGLQGGFGGGLPGGPAMPPPPPPVKNPFEEFFDSLRRFFRWYLSLFAIVRLQFEGQVRVSKLNSSGSKYKIELIPGKLYVSAPDHGAFLYEDMTDYIGVISPLIALDNLPGGWGLQEWYTISEASDNNKVIKINMVISEQGNPDSLVITEVSYL